MSDSMQFVKPFVGTYEAFLYLLRRYQTLQPDGPSLTEDQTVYVAGVLSAFNRNQFTIGGMRISDPSDLAMPDVLEYLFHHRLDAELAGGYLLACTGSITIPKHSTKYDSHRINLYDIIAKACFQIAEESSRYPGHKSMMHSVASEYRGIRKEISRFTRDLNIQSENLARPT